MSNEQRISANSFFSQSSVDSTEAKSHSPTVVQEEDLQSEETDVVCIAADNGCGIEVKRSSITASVGSGVNNADQQIELMVQPEIEHVMPEIDQQQQQQQITIVGNDEVQKNDEVNVDTDNEKDNQRQHEFQSVDEKAIDVLDVPMLNAPQVYPQPRQSLVLNVSDDVFDSTQQQPTLTNRPLLLGSENPIGVGREPAKQQQTTRQKSVESPSSEEKIMAQMREKQNVSNLIAKFNTVTGGNTNNGQSERNGCAKQKEHEVGAIKINDLRQKFSQK